VSLRFAPAAVPVVLFLAGVAAAPRLAWLPVALAFGLIALGASWRGSAGYGLAALAAGAVLGVGSAEQLPSDDRVLAVESEGEICGFWRERAGFSTRSARLCPDWLRQGESLLVRPPRVWLELPREMGEPPAFGARVRVRGTLSRFPGFANEAATAPGPWRLRVKSARHLRLAARAGPFAAAAGAVRARVLRSIDRTGEPNRPGIALARAFVLGDESGLTEARTRALRRAGLSHLLAVSGFNVTLVAAVAALAAGGASPRGRLIAPAVAIVLYLAAVGPEPSLLRATWMSGAMLTALALRRAGSALQALCLTGALLVALEPRALHDAGFQLSFGATACLVLLAERWAESLASMPRPLARALAASFAAQAGTLPWSVSAFAEMAPSAPIWNLVAVPWASLWMLVGLLWTLLALIAPPAVAAALAPLLDLGAAPFGWLEALPPSSWSSIWLPGGWLAGACVALVLAFAFEVPRTRPWLLLLFAAWGVSPSAEAGRGVAEVVFADVGQGDAALLREGSATLLIDGGGLPGRDVGAAVLRPMLARRGVRGVDVALLTHADLDHCLGLVDLAAYVAIDEVWLPPDAARVACAARLAGQARRGVRVLAAGERRSLGAIRIDVLHPAIASREAGSNRASLVVRIELGGRQLLFAGDLPGAEEIRLARENPAALHADLLKVAHHGSSSSSTAAFLVAVSPRLAVISAGARNGFGHPAPAALERLAAAGARILRTDRDGELVVRWRAGEPWHLDLPASPRAIAPER